MKTNEAKISYFYDEIGKIDDRFISEALFTEKVRRRNDFKKKLSVFAAVAAIVAVLCFTVIGNRTDGKGNAPSEDYPGSSESSTSQNDYLAAYLSQNTLEGVKYELEEIESELIYDSSMRLIWTFDGDVYYSVAVQNSLSASELESLLENDRYTKLLLGENSPEYGDFRFYVSHGNGILETPYLERNVGRYSVGSLQNYLPEVYPSDSFARFVESLIG